ncbi:MAG TPA: CGNR zinc finger domain-containing protein [Gaiellaceae bacterium]|nr:CGNR zinc finger domain-containing protein [Gaiellaceae bacterium]
METSCNCDLLLDFVNTLDKRPHSEELETPAALAEWLAGRGLVEPGMKATAADLREAIELREALRTLLATHNEVEGDFDAASAVLDRVSRGAKLGVCFAGGGLHLEPQCSGIRAALGKIVAEVATAMSEGTWARMKACRADDCLWVFLDTAKNQSRAWCSMKSCGNREKVRAYRARHAHA